MAILYVVSYAVCEVLAFLPLAGDVSPKPASLEASTPAVGCDGKANLLLALETFLTDGQALCGCSTVVAVFGLLTALLVRVCVCTISGRLKVVYMRLLKGMHLFLRKVYRLQLLTCSDFIYYRNMLKYCLLIKIQI